MGKRNKTTRTKTIRKVWGIVQTVAAEQHVPAPAIAELESLIEQVFMNFTFPAFKALLEEKCPVIKDAVIAACAKDAAFSSRLEASLTKSIRASRDELPDWIWEPIELLLNSHTSNWGSTCWNNLMMNHAPPKETWPIIHQKMTQMFADKQNRLMELMPVFLRSTLAQSAEETLDTAWTQFQTLRDSNSQGIHYRTVYPFIDRLCRDFKAPEEKVDSATESNASKLTISQYAKRAQMCLNLSIFLGEQSNMAIKNKQFTGLFEVFYDGAQCLQRNFHEEIENGSVGSMAMWDDYFFRIWRCFRARESALQTQCALVLQKCVELQGFECTMGLSAKLDGTFMDEQKDMFPDFHIPRYHLSHVEGERIINKLLDSVLEPSSPDFEKRFTNIKLFFAISARKDIDVFIDGANVGHLRGCFSYQQLDDAIRDYVQNNKSVAAFLHRFRAVVCPNLFGDQRIVEIVQKWFDSHQLIFTPQAMNDDIMWLAACIYASAFKKKQIAVVTNDIFRDHVLFVGDTVFRRFINTVSSRFRFLRMPWVQKLRRPNPEYRSSKQIERKKGRSTGIKRSRRMMEMGGSDTSDEPPAKKMRLNDGESRMTENRQINFPPMTSASAELEFFDPHPFGILPMRINEKMEDIDRMASVRGGEEKTDENGDSRMRTNYFRELLECCELEYPEESTEIEQKVEFYVVPYMDDPAALYSLDKDQLPPAPFTVLSRVKWFFARRKHPVS